MTDIAITRKQFKPQFFHFLDFTFIKVETVIEPQLVEGFTEDSEAAHQQPKTGSFCTLCLRKCSPEHLLEFSSGMTLHYTDIDAAERKVHQALGLVLKLENRDICHTCWKLVQMITDFRECCTKAASKLEQFPLGLANSEEWTSEATLSGIDQIQKAIWEHSWAMDAQQGHVVQEKLDTNLEMIDVLPNVADDESKHDTLNDMEAILSKEFKRSRRKPTKRKKPVPKEELDVIDDVVVHTPKVQDDEGEYQPAKRMIASKPIELEEDHYQVEISSCTICDRNFDGHRALILHRTRCTTESPSTKKYYSCPICTASFLENSGLTFHLNKHKGLRPFKCRKFCDRTYASNYTRIKHERRYCEQDGRICPTCGASLKNEASLKLHIQSVHGEAKYSCEICGKRFKNLYVCMIFFLF